MLLINTMLWWRRSRGCVWIVTWLTTSWYTVSSRWRGLTKRCISCGVSTRSTCRPFSHTSKPINSNWGLRSQSLATPPPASSYCRRSSSTSSSCVSLSRCSSSSSNNLHNSLRRSKRCKFTTRPRSWTSRRRLSCCLWGSRICSYVRRTCRITRPRRTPPPGCWGSRVSWAILCCCCQLTVTVVVMGVVTSMLEAGCITRRFRARDNLLRRGCFE